MGCPPRKKSSKKQTRPLHPRSSDVIQSATARRECQRAFPVRLYAGERGFTFSQAGEYDVEVTCAGIVGAATTHVRVIAPVQPIDVEQSRALLANPDVAYFFLIDGGDHLTAAKNLLISVSNTNSIFQPYARVVLGLSLARDFAFVSRGVVRRADPEAASGYLAQPADAALSAYYGLLRKVSGNGWRPRRAMPHWHSSCEAR